MDTAQGTLLRAGAKDQLLGDFTALGEATTLEGVPKYAERPTMEALAKFLTAQSGGPNKDVALYELAHFVYGVSRVLGAGQLTDFFLSPEKASPANYRQNLNSGETITDVQVTAEFLRLTYEDKSFDIRYGRMPLLAALYEFLSSMDGFAHFQVITDLFDDLVDGVLNDKNLRACANGLASILRKYRIANLTTQEADGKFVQVFNFLRTENQENHIIIEDDSVLDFWALHNKGKDYKGYRTVFDLFSDFTKAFDEAKMMEASSRAAVLGVNMEQGEIDIATHDVDMAGFEEWVSPFDLFDTDDYGDVRFFKKKTERGPIESLMAYGPDALRLPLAFIRYEIFGQVQAGITNDLQVGRGKASVEKRISCEEVMTYAERIVQCETILEHVKKLQASSLHVISQDEDNVVAFPGAARDEARKAFSKMNRKGLNEENTGLIRDAVRNLVVIAGHLEKYIEILKRKQAMEKFDEDKIAFRTQFKQLYGEVLS